MHRLVFIKSGIVAHVHDLGSTPVTIGRDPDCDIVLDDSSVSRVHARVVPGAGGYRILDEGSTNGIWQGRRRIEEAPLAMGRPLQIGDFSTQFVVDSSASTSRPGPRQGATDPRRSLEALFLLASEFTGLVETEELLEKMIDCLLSVFEAERGFILLFDAATGRLRPAIRRHIEAAQLEDAISRTVTERAIKARRPLLLDDLSADPDLSEAESLERSAVRSILAAPLVRSGRVLGVVYLDSQVSHRRYTPDDRETLSAFSSHAAAALENAHEKEKLHEDVSRLRALERERAREGVEPAHGLVAESTAMKEAALSIEALAEYDTTALILGESGTGKEVVARAIHQASPRRDRPFVAVNCMALSPTLVESELFGHEKGAFSGAGERKIGRFEMADGGTLFLDEVGELSLPIQVKLLRVLQERQFERVGGTEPLSIDVRLVAATNADLARAIEEGRFREDLYYRLNVFPLKLPPLRERREDVPALARLFISHFAERMGKPIHGISDQACQALVAYDWPGNVRELRNVIERAFVLERSDAIQLQSLPQELRSLSPLQAPGGTTAGSEAASSQGVASGLGLEEARRAFERRHILEALERNQLNVTATAGELGLPRKSLYRRLEACGIDLGEIQSRREAEERDSILAALRKYQGNVSAAAAALGMPRATLYRRLEALGIDPRS